MRDCPTLFDGTSVPRRWQDQMETAIPFRVVMPELVAEQERLGRRRFVIILGYKKTESAWSCSQRRTLLCRLPCVEHLADRLPLLLGGELVQLMLRRPRMNPRPSPVADRKVLGVIDRKKRHSWTHNDCRFISQLAASCVPDRAAAKPFEPAAFESYPVRLRARYQPRKTTAKTIGSRISCGLIWFSV